MRGLRLWPLAQMVVVCGVTAFYCWFADPRPYERADQAFTRGMRTADLEWRCLGQRFVWPNATQQVIYQNTLTATGDRLTCWELWDVLDRIRNDWDPRKFKDWRDPVCLTCL